MLTGNFVRAGHTNASLVVCPQPPGVWTRAGCTDPLPIRRPDSKCLGKPILVGGHKCGQRKINEIFHHESIADRQPQPGNRNASSLSSRRDLAEPFGMNGGNNPARPLAEQRTVVGYTGNMQSDTGSDRHFSKSHSETASGQVVKSID